MVGGGLSLGTVSRPALDFHPGWAVHWSGPLCSAWTVLVLLTKALRSLSPWLPTLVTVLG